MIRRPPRSTHCISSAASDVYKRQGHHPALTYMHTYGLVWKEGLALARPFVFSLLALAGGLHAYAARRAASRPPLCRSRLFVSLTDGGDRPRPIESEAPGAAAASAPPVGRSVEALQGLNAVIRAGGASRRDGTGELGCTDSLGKRGKCRCILIMSKYYGPFGNLSLIHI